MKQKNVVLSWIEKRRWYLITALFTSLVIFWPYNVFEGTSIWFLHYNMMTYNELGDFIGGITAPILSTVAIILLFKTYKSQKKELRLTQDALKSQQATTSLFNMFNILNEIVASLEAKVLTERNNPSSYTKETLNGRKLLARLYQQLHYYYRRANTYFQYNAATNSFDEYIKTVVDVKKGVLADDPDDFVYKIDKTGESLTVSKYLNTYITPSANMFFEGGIKDDIAHYIKYVEVIFEFIEKEFKKEDDKAFYYKVFRSQLSYEEIGLLFYWSFTITSGRFQAKMLRAKLLSQFEHLRLGDAEHINVYRCLMNHSMNPK
jgi:hypothetical protein